MFKRIKQYFCKHTAFSVQFFPEYEFWGVMRKPSRKTCVDCKMSWYKTERLEEIKL